MRRVVGNFFILMLILSGSCVKRTIPDKASLLDMHELEVDYMLYHPEAIRKKDLQRNLDFLVRNYIDTVSLEQLFRNKPTQKLLTKEVRDFYKNIDYRLAWNSSFGKLTVSTELIGVLGEAYKKGLNPEDYGIQEIIERQRSVFQHGNLPSNLRDLLELDIFMTSRYVLLGHHLSAGRIDPVEVLDAWHIEVDRKELSEKLSKGLLKNDLASALSALEPNDERYHQLKEYFLSYYNIISSGVQVAEISEAVTNLTPGDTSQLIISLKEKLVMLGDMDGKRRLSNEYDGELKNAISQFQIRHGLDATGLLDDATFSELNVSIHEKLRIININLDRMKWFPEIEDRYILVNVPEFKMKLYDNGKKELEMKAIVGREVNPTPVMTEDMTYIVFNPTWTVPYSITTEQFLPKIQKDVKFLEKNNYLLYDGWGQNANLIDPEDVEWDEYTEENFPYVIVQEPGPNNALGQVQFMMPNNYAIYLHDTPADYLFDRDERAFSHGCVRLEQPLVLAEYLLQNKPGWNRDSLENALSQDEPVNVVLQKKWPVHLLYKTAWVDEDGLLNFRNDVYGIDSAQIAALEKLDLDFPIARISGQKKDIK
jgi:L,D-transpeptidase YcbB